MRQEIGYLHLPHLLASAGCNGHLTFITYRGAFLKNVVSLLGVFYRLIFAFHPPTVLHAGLTCQQAKNCRGRCHWPWILYVVIMATFRDVADVYCLATTHRVWLGYLSPRNPELGVHATISF